MVEFLQLFSLSKNSCTSLNTKSNSEICLLGIRGKPKPVSNKVSSVVLAKMTNHSKKPEEVRNRIIELCGDLPRIELFARDQAQGWDAWGDEVPKELQTPLKFALQDKGVKDGN